MRDVLAQEPTLAGHLIAPEAAPILAPLVSPPLTPDQASGLDLILEGFLLHFGRPRHLAPEPGGEVLAGDYCYAHGLVRIADAGELFPIEALSDLIALGAGAVAAGRRDALVPLWRATVAAIATTGDPAGAALRRRFATARDALRVAADPSDLARIAAELAPTPELEEALRS